jgi:hypothetical protein
LHSAAADSVWHAWAALDPVSLNAFCIMHFGRTIPHIEAGAMGTPMEHALANCLVAARALEGESPAGPGVPRLFALDCELGMPGGFCYQLALGEVACSRLDQAGRPSGKLFFPEGLASAQLLAWGLIAQSDHDKSAKSKNNRDGSGNGGSGCGADGSCDAGASCGGCGGD